jgi:addiction module HigA family antidote
MIKRYMTHLDQTKKILADYQRKEKLNGKEKAALAPTPTADILTPIGNEIEYRGLNMQQLAQKIGLTDTELNDVLDGKRSHRPVVVIDGVDPLMLADNLLPCEPIHPGSILKREILYRELDLKQLAQQMGITGTELNEILDCKRPVTQSYAQKFEAALELDAQPLRNMQADYDIEAVLIPLRNLRRLQKEQFKKQQLNKTGQMLIDRKKLPLYKKKRQQLGKRKRQTLILQEWQHTRGAARSTTGQLTSQTDLIQMPAPYNAR